MKKQRLLFIALIASMSAIAQLPTNGLVGYYPFNGNAKDSSSNANNGTVNGATLTADRFGNPNSAYLFAGGSDNIEVPHSSSLNNNNGSICFWVKDNTLPNSHGSSIIYKSDGNGVSVNQYSNGFAGIMDYASRNQSGMGGTSTPYDSNWHFIVFTYQSNGNRYIYSDGILAATSTVADFNHTSTTNLRFGRAQDSWWDSFTGSLDDIAIYNRALTQSEVTQLYTGGCVLTAAITPQSTTTFCAGSFVNLNANTGTNYTYKWYNNGNIINNATSSSYSATQSGSYTVKTDSLGCSGSSSAVAVTVNALPVVSINSIPNSIYANSSALVLSGNPTGGTFSGNGVSGNSFTPKNAGLGTKQISYKYTDGNTCSSYATATTIVTDTTGIVCTKYDTVTKYISVTDTLVINAKLTGIASPNNTNMLKVFPNPTNDKLFINTGNYAVMNNYTIKITTMLGQEVFNTKVTKQEFVIDLNTLGSKGIYFFELYDGNNTKIEARKIILQ